MANEYTPDLITLIGDDGKEIEFEILDIIENDGSTAVCHSGGDSKTDAVRSAGDQGNLAGQIKRFRGADRHISYLLKVMLCNSKAAHRAAGERDWK